MNEIFHRFLTSLLISIQRLMAGLGRGRSDIHKNTE